MPAIEADAIARMEALGEAGFTISVCFGPARGDRCCWSVQVLSPMGEEFEDPYAATSFVHAIDIAEIEITRRGWQV